MSTSAATGLGLEAHSMPGGGARHRVSVTFAHSQPGESSSKLQQEHTCTQHSKKSTGWALVPRLPVMGSCSSGPSLRRRELSPAGTSSSCQVMATWGDGRKWEGGGVRQPQLNTPNCCHQRAGRRQHQGSSTASPHRPGNLKEGGWGCACAPPPAPAAGPPGSRAAAPAPAPARAA